PQRDAGSGKREASCGRRRSRWNRIRADAREFGFDLTQILQQSIQLGGPAQLLVLVDFREHDSAWLRECDYVRRIETAYPRVLPTKLHDHTLQPILFRLPVAQRMRLQQVIDSPRLSR